MIYAIDDVDNKVKNKVELLITKFATAQQEFSGFLADLYLKSSSVL